MALEVPEAGMKIQKGFQCKSCSSFLSHPVDVCPVCSDQFYWRVVPETPVDGLQRDAFIASMVNLVEGRVTPEFLTHGGHLWLPYRFWSIDPSGNALLEFSWLDDLEVFQHDNQKAAKSSAEPEKKQEPAPWDTVPKMEAPDFTQYKPGPQAAVATASVAPHEVESDSVRASDSPGERNARARAPERMPSPSLLGLLRGDLFVPLMIFLFLVLLSLTYLVLRYHKNQLTPLAPQTHMEVSDERCLLS